MCSEGEPYLFLPVKCLVAVVNVKNGGSSVSGSDSSGSTGQ